MNDWWDIQISSAGNYRHLLARRHDAVNCQLQYTNPTKLLHWTEVLQTRGLVPQNSSLRVGWTSLVSVEKLTLCTKECSVTFCYSLEVHFSVERWWECSHSILTAALGWRNYSKPPIYTGKKKHSAHRHSKLNQGREMFGAIDPPILIHLRARVVSFLPQVNPPLSDTIIVSVVIINLSLLITISHI